MLSCISLLLKDVVEVPAEPLTCVHHGSPSFSVNLLIQILP